MTDEQPELTPAQKHYLEAERLLEVANDGENVYHRDPHTIAEAQVHATLASAANHAAILEFVSAEVTGAAVARIKGYLGLTS